MLRTLHQRHNQWRNQFELSATLTTRHQRPAFQNKRIFIWYCRILIHLLIAVALIRQNFIGDITKRVWEFLISNNLLQICIDNFVIISSCVIIVNSSIHKILVCGVLPRDDLTTDRYRSGVSFANNHTRMDEWMNVSATRYFLLAKLSTYVHFR